MDTLKLFFMTALTIIAMSIIIDHKPTKTTVQRDFMETGFVAVIPKEVETKN